MKYLPFLIKIIRSVTVYYRIQYNKMINNKFFKLGRKNFADVFRGSENRRYGDKSLIDQFITLENKSRKSRFFYDKIKKKFSIFSKIFFLTKNLKSRKNRMTINRIKKKIYLLEKKTFLLEKLKTETLSLIGNLIHNSGVFLKSENKSRIFIWKFFKIYCNNLYNHVDLLRMIGGVDYKRGSLVSGQRGYFLKSPGIIINLAILRYGLDFLMKRDFVPLQTPLFMDKKKIKKCCQLNDFEEQLYVIGKNGRKFLIATSEQPMSSFHSEEKFELQQLPLKYAGFSSCFRKESGSHGKDTLGIFRVHHFEKIEQFVISQSSKSWLVFEEMLKNAHDFYSSLNLPFISIEIPSGSINNTASKKIDLLGWFPFGKTHRELVSCSNCTDFQSRDMKIFQNSSKKGKTDNFVHLLNSTLCASSRTICCLLENYQNPSGILIPNVLKSYIGISFVPFLQRYT